VTESLGVRGRDVVILVTIVESPAPGDAGSRTVDELFFDNLQWSRVKRAALGLDSGVEGQRQRGYYSARYETRAAPGGGATGASAAAA
jgi:hypothetical protein